MSLIWNLTIWCRGFSRFEECGLTFHSHHSQVHCCILIRWCMQKHNDAIKTSEHSSLEKYTTHFIWKGSKRLLKVLLTPTLMAITAFLSRSPGQLNRGPGGPAFLGQVLLPASSLQFQLLNRGSWGPPLLGVGSLYSILSPTDWLPVFTRVM